ncbi:Gfo/Idh/MocA family oxidoreductase [Streptomyces sp. TG1A-60]|uniref:Gfo/Idh/MocA family protein n=1 Tax=Streptomyces sp. TG1A-60 TaxID=3129111 RepID=UPI0030CE6A82
MPSPRPPYRVAIIGTGGIAHAHAAALTELSERARLVAVADVDPTRAAEFADRFSVPHVFSDPQALLESGKIDLVHICTPPQTHAPLAAMAMRAGVTALVEKPTALSLREMDHLAAVQEQTGSKVLTVFQHRYGAAAVRLRRLVAAGVLGRPLVATCETLWYRSDEYFDVPWRGRWDVEGGGPTMGHGIHQFDLMLSVLGPWSLITALADRQVRPTDTEDVSVAAVRFDNGALATVVNSLLSPGRRPGCASTSHTPRSKSSTSTATARSTGGSRRPPATRSSRPCGPPATSRTSQAATGSRSRPCSTPGTQARNPVSPCRTRAAPWSSRPRRTPRPSAESASPQGN